MAAYYIGRAQSTPSTGTKRRASRPPSPATVRSTTSRPARSVSSSRSRCHEPRAEDHRGRRGGAGEPATKEGPHDGPPRRARPRAQGEAEGQGGRREAARRVKPREEAPIRGSVGGVAPQPPERGGKAEGPDGAGAPRDRRPLGHDPT